jgi:hypothetical protein
MDASLQDIVGADVDPRLFAGEVAYLDVGVDLR